MSEQSSRSVPESLTDRLLLQPPAWALNPRRDPLPSPLRRTARLGVLDSSEWFGATSGGVRTYLLRKAAYVEGQSGLRQVIVVPGARALVGEASGVRCYQIASTPVPRQPPYRALLDWRAVRRIALHERPDIIEAGSPLTVPWLLRGAARRLDVPLVCYHHGLLPHNFTRHGPGESGISRLAEATAWRYLRRLDGLFALTLAGSDYAVRELRSAGMERTVRVPLGVDLALFHPERLARSVHVRARYGLPADRPLFGYVGRFSAEKEVELVLRAWPSVTRKSDAALVLVGDGPERGRLLALAAGLPVSFVPFVSDRADLADIIASLDVYLSPGSIETFGLAALEAMASGIPVLSADRGGVAELLERSGAGTSFTAGDAAALAEAAVTFTRRDLPALGALGRQYAEREHDWNVTFNRLFAIYSAVLQGGDPESAAAAPTGA